jgi:hypothetical protein
MSLIDNKYLKYKNKYLKLKYNQNAGVNYKYITPWKEGSEKIYISLLIDPMSPLGIELSYRYNNITKQQNINIFNKNKKYNPHITLFDGYIKKDSKLFNILNTNIDYIYNEIKNIIIKNLYGNIFYSQISNYKKYNDWFVRVYNNLYDTKGKKTASLDIVQQKIIDYLLYNIRNLKTYYISKEIKPFYNPNPINHNFIHYMIEKHKSSSNIQSNSEFAIINYMKIPVIHLSLSKTTENLDKIQREFTSKTNSSLSYINLWNKYDNVYNDNQNHNIKGSISEIYISFNQYEKYYKFNI